MRLRTIDLDVPGNLAAIERDHPDPICEDSTYLGPKYADDPVQSIPCCERVSGS
jgi:hypothetical protein